MSARYKSRSDDDLYFKVKEIYIDSWTIDEYKSAVKDETFMTSVKTFLDSSIPVEESDETEDIEDLMNSKYYFAGGSCRYMFVYNTKMVIKSLEEAVPICGTECYSNHHDSDDVDSICFRKTFTHVDTFPCHWSHEGVSESNDTKQRRRKVGIQALKTNGVIIPLLDFNAGCDVVFVLDFEKGGMAVFFFEAKYYYQSEDLDRESASYKACIVLNELLDSSNPLDDCKVLAVSFIFCVTDETKIEYDLNYKGKYKKLSIQQCIDQLQQKGAYLVISSIRMKGLNVSVVNM